MSKLATTLYLVLYNGACMALWAWTLFLALEAVYDNWQYGYTWDKGLGSVWKAASAPLIIAQWGMCMEILHAVTGLVPSPAHVVLLQVFSRVFVLAAAQNFHVVTTQWACGLMIISWSLVEVPRYAFYIFAKLGPPGPKGTPYFIFFLRYSLFFILYPTGITGEVLTLMNALPHLRPYTLGYTHLSSTVKMYGYPIPATWIYFTIKFVLWTYLPGGPFMYMNMVSNRKNAFSKRNPPPAKPETGTVFPLDGSPEGRSIDLGVYSWCRLLMKRSHHPFFHILCMYSLTPSLLPPLSSLTLSLSPPSLTPCLHHNTTTVTTTNTFPPPS